MKMHNTSLHNMTKERVGLFTPISLVFHLLPVVDAGPNKFDAAWLEALAKKVHILAEPRLRGKAVVLPTQHITETAQFLRTRNNTPLLVVLWQNTSLAGVSEQSLLNRLGLESDSLPETFPFLPRTLTEIVPLTTLGGWTATNHSNLWRCIACCPGWEKLTFAQHDSLFLLSQHDSQTLVSDLLIERHLAHLHLASADQEPDVDGSLLLLYLAHTLSDTIERLFRFLSIGDRGAVANQSDQLQTVLFPEKGGI